MVIWLRILGAILIIAGFMVPYFFELKAPYSKLDASIAEIKLAGGMSITGDELQALSQKKIIKYLWLISIPVGILLGTFWIAIASVIEKLERINNYVRRISKRTDAEEEDQPEKAG